MFDISRARDFVNSHGDIIERARLKRIMFNNSPQDDVLETMAKMQHPDGGFSYWLPDKNTSTVCDTAYILGWFDDLSVRNSPIVDAAINFLLKHQKEDGGWDEVPGLENLEIPEFLIPGQIRTRVWLTAYCAHWLLLFGCDDMLEGKTCPVEYLISKRESSGKLIGYQRATWDALPVFLHFFDLGLEPFGQAMRVVEKELQPERWPASYTVWLLRCLRDCGLPTSHPIVKSCLDVLVTSQRSDGSWQPEDAERYAPSATVDVVRIFRDFGII
jgi:hypothetical protein